MKLHELNNYLTEQNFDTVSTELEDHIKQLEDDIKEVNLNIVRLMTNKAYKVIEKLHDIIKTEKNILTLGKNVDKYTKQLQILKGRFMSLREKYKDNEFEKDIMLEVDSILKDLIDKIGGVVGDGEKAVKTLSDEISKSSVPKSNRKPKSVPKGYAVDMKTKKGYVHKEDKKDK